MNSRENDPRINRDPREGEREQQEVEALAIAAAAAQREAAKVAAVTFHGLCRTFTQRGRSVVPAGAVAQIEGHKPSATAEGYAVLPLDDLRPYAALIEAKILELAGVTFDAEVEPGRLRVVA